MDHLLRILRGELARFDAPKDQGAGEEERDETTDTENRDTPDDSESRDDQGEGEAGDPDPARDLDLESMGIDPPLRVGEFQRRMVECEVRRSSDGKRTVVVINTASLDSHRTEIIPKGGNLKDYKKNPVVLINHDRYLVAGTSTVSRRDDRIVAEMEDDEWDLDDPAIVPWFNKVKRGIVRMASIGFIPLVIKRMLIDPEKEDKWDNWKWVIEKWTLREWSWVSIGSNYDALVESRTAQELHVSKLEEQIARQGEQMTDLGRKVDLLLEKFDTTAIDAPPDNAAADAVSERGQGHEDEAATQPASDVPDEPAAEAPEEAHRRRSEQPRTAGRPAIDPAEISRAIVASIPGAVSDAVLEAAKEIGTERLRARGKL